MVSKIPIVNIFSALAEMELVDYAAYAAFFHIRGTFPRFPAVIFLVAKKRGLGGGGWRWWWGWGGGRNGDRKYDFRLGRNFWDTGNTDGGSRFHVCRGVSRNLATSVI